MGQIGEPHGFPSADPLRLVVGCRDRHVRLADDPLAPRVPLLPEIRHSGWLPTGLRDRTGFGGEWTNNGGFDYTVKLATFSSSICMAPKKIHTSKPFGLSILDSGMLILPKGRHHIDLWEKAVRSGMAVLEKQGGFAVGRI